MELYYRAITFYGRSSQYSSTRCALYTGNDLVRPDAALELTQRKHLLDSAMPYLSGSLREDTGRINALDKKTQRKVEAEEKNMSAANNYVPNYMRPIVVPTTRHGQLGKYGYAAGDAARKPRFHRAEGRRHGRWADASGRHATANGPWPTLMSHCVDNNGLHLEVLRTLL